MNKTKISIFAVLALSVGYTTQVQSMLSRKLTFSRQPTQAQSQDPILAPSPFLKDTTLILEPTASPYPSSSELSDRTPSPTGPQIKRTIITTITTDSKKPSSPNQGPFLIPSDRIMTSPSSAKRDWADEKIDRAVIVAINHAVERKLPELEDSVQKVAYNVIQEGIHPLIPTQDQTRQVIEQAANVATKNTVSATRLIAPHVSQLVVGGVAATTMSVAGASTVYNALNNPNITFGNAFPRVVAGAGIAAGAVGAYSRYADYLTRKYEAQDAARKQKE